MCTRLHALIPRAYSGVHALIVNQYIPVFVHFRLQCTLEFVFQKVSKGAHYVSATKVHGWQNCVYPPETMEAVMRDPTSPHGYRSHRGAGAHFSGHLKLFFDHSILHFLAEKLSRNPNRIDQICSHRLNHGAKYLSTRIFQVFIACFEIGRLFLAG